MLTNLSVARTYLRRLALVGVALLVGCSREYGDAVALNYPVCEPSAALSVSCPHEVGRCILVADDDVANELYLFPIVDGKLDTAARKGLKMGPHAIDDVEALVDLGAGRVLVVGSHSRKKTCVQVSERQRMLPVRLESDRLWPDGAMLQSLGISREVFTRNGAAGPSGLLGALWSAVAQGDGLAESAREGRNVSACDAAGSLDIEGAVGVPLPSGQVDVWLGLRKPQVELDGRLWSALVHLEGLQRMRLDQVALIDLQGRGIRELAFDGEWIWGIAAGPEDKRRNFALWRFPVSDLRPDARLHPEIVRELPDGSEGLAVAGDRLYVFVDGNGLEDRKTKECDPGGAFLSLSRL